MILLLIAAGGALGAVGRYLLGEWVQAGAGHAFPWGTFTVNITGSLLLGAMAGFATTSAVSEELRILVSVGLMGAFTTFSTYSMEALVMLRSGEVGKALVYVGSSVARGLLAAWTGWQATLSLAGG
jgi:CrcB protein